MPLLGLARPTVVDLEVALGVMLWPDHLEWKIPAPCESPASRVSDLQEAFEQTRAGSAVCPDHSTYPPQSLPG